MLIMEVDIVRKGKDCVALAESVSSDISRGNISAAEESLQNLVKDGKDLVKFSEQRASDIEKMEEQKSQEVEEIQRQIAVLGKQEESQKSYLSKLQSDLSSKQSILNEEYSRRSSAECDLSNAEQRLHEAKEDAESRRIGGGVAGAFIGTLLLPGFGTVFGAAAGTGAGEICNRIIDDEKEARRKLDRCRERYNNAERDVRSAQTQVKDVQSELSRISSECNRLKSQSMKCNEEAKKMKDGALFYRHATNFWKDFQQLSEHGVDRTELVKRIVAKAKEREDFSFLTKDPSKHIAMTFLEAWEEMEANIEYAEESEFGFVL